MKRNLKSGSHGTAVGAALALMLLPLSNEAHDEAVHRQIARSAFRSSSGAASFLVEQLGSSYSPFTDGPTLLTRASDYPANRPDSPMGWLSWGAYMEDDEDPTFAGAHFIRSSDHFYAVAHTPRWLTDRTESPRGRLPDGLTDSFTWATSPGMAGPNLLNTFAGPNNQTWQDARNWELKALTLPTKPDRDASLALCLYALGHVLHLNEDLSQPDHVRNDEHIPWRPWTPRGKHWIEDYGLHKYLEPSQKAGTLDQTFPLRARGWQSPAERSVHSNAKKVHSNAKKPISYQFTGTLANLYNKICEDGAQVAGGDIKELLYQIADDVKSDPNWKQRVASAARNAESHLNNGTTVRIVDSTGNYVH